MQSRLSAPLLAALILVSPALLTGCAGAARHRETRVVVIPDPAPVAAVDVRTGNGAVDISTAPRETQATIVATIRARTRERLEQASVLADYEGDTLRVRVEWPEGRRKSNEGASFDIEVPGASDVTVETGNGRIALAGARGRADLRTSNGRIVVSRHEGPVVADTSNGRVEVSGDLHDVRVDSSNGDIVVAGAAGPVHARTSNGSIAVELTDDNPGPLEARSSNGAIRLDLGPAFQGRLTLDTSNGRVRLENAPLARIHSISRSRAELTLGDGAQRSIADTSNGRVTVNFRGGS